MTELDHLTRYRVEGWNSHRALAVLSRKNLDDLNHIVTFMAATLRTAYGQLRDAIENPNSEEASWHSPKLTLYYELPFGMISGGLLEIETQEDLWSCEMVVVLDLLSGQLILEWNEESQDFEQCFGPDSRTARNPDLASKWPIFTSGHESIQGLDEEGNRVEIGLAFEFLPRFVIPRVERRTFGEITVGPTLAQFGCLFAHFCPLQLFESTRRAFGRLLTTIRTIFVVRAAPMASAENFLSELNALHYTTGC